MISPECFRIARISLNSPSSSLQISNFVLKLPRQRQCYQSSYVNSPSSSFWNFVLNTGSIIFQCVALASSLSAYHGVKVDILED